MNKEKDLSTEYAEQEAEREQELKEEYANSTSRAVAILRKVGREADAEELEEKAWDIEEDWITELDMRKAEKDEEEKRGPAQPERIVTGEMAMKTQAIAEILEKIVKGTAIDKEKKEANEWAKELVIQIEEIREQQIEEKERRKEWGIEDEESNKKLEEELDRISEKKEENDRMIKEANEMRTEDQIEEEKNNEETSRIREQQIIKEREE